jgi:membrane protein
MDSDAKPSSPFASPVNIARRLRQAGGLLLFAARRFYDGNYFQTAASLTYTTLLAVVPLMTIGFAIFSAFPSFSALQSDIQALIFRNLAPEIGDTLLEHVLAFMANAGKMPVFGVLGLAVTSVLLIWTIEGAFSSIWRVHEPRSLVTRILSFWAIVSLGPLFAGASLSLSDSLWTALQGEQFHGIAAPLLGVSSLSPLLVQMVGCALLYLIIPNRSVEWRDALAGGVVGSVLLEVSKAAFAWYMREFPAYQTIYGALATVPIFLFWLYVAWSTLLFGAVVTAAIPDWRAGRFDDGEGGAPPPGDLLTLALCVLDELSDSALKGRGLRRRALTRRLSFAPAQVEEMLERLRDAGWSAYTTQETWVVARDLSEATLSELLTDLRLGVQGPLRGRGAADRAWGDALARRLDAAEAGQGGPLGVSVKALLRSGAAAA